MFYILSMDGRPLMPTSRYRHIKELIKTGRAVKVSSVPFVVRLLYSTPEQTQPLFYGKDPGRTNIGAAVVDCKGNPVFAAHLVTRNKEIPKLMSKRAEARRKHRSYGRRKRRQRRAVAADTTVKTYTKMRPVSRSKQAGVIERVLPGCQKPVECIGIRNKEARFNNRLRTEGWLTPTANQLLQTHVNLLKKVMGFLPITSVVMEMNRFAFMQMDNPMIQKWEYQKGPLYGKGSVEEAVYDEQDGHCIFCSKPIKEYHHIIPRRKRGSETLQNRAGLCREHHALVHKDKEWADKLADIKVGLDKRYGAVSVLNQIMPALADAYSDILPTFVTDGRSTKRFREEHNISKDHHLDAYCIACSVLDDPTVLAEHETPFEIRQFRRHDRKACKQEMLDRKYVAGRKVVAVNRKKSSVQTADSLQEYVTAGGRTDILRVKEHHPTYQRMGRYMPGSLFRVGKKTKVLTASKGLHNGEPDYYVFSDGTKATPRNCKFIKNNTGLVFVSKTAL